MQASTGPERDIIVIAASTGGLKALRTIVTALPSRLPAAVFIVQHIGAHQSSMPELLSRTTALSVGFALDGQRFRHGRIYVAPPDRHLILTPDRIHLTRGPKERGTRPAGDPLFRSAAESCGSRVIGVVLTGGDSDGTDGLRAIKAHGGTSVVQDPDEAEVPQMPDHALRGDDPDYCLTVADIGPLLVRLVGHGERDSAG